MHPLVTAGAIHSEIAYAFEREQFDSSHVSYAWVLPLVFFHGARHGCGVRRGVEQNEIADPRAPGGGNAQVSEVAIAAVGIGVPPVMLQD